MMTLQKFLAVLLLLILAGCSAGYENDGKAVYYKYWNEGSGRHKEKINADAASFTILKFNSYAKDNRHVFYNGAIIPGADAASFEAIGEWYARDNNRGYYGKSPVQHSVGKTFRVINGYYSTDGKDFFYDTAALHVAAPEDFRFVYGEGSYQCWTTDGKYHYYNQYKIPSDDYAHLIIYEKSMGIAKDRHWVYFLDHKLNEDIDGNRVIDTIDVASFSVNGYLDCRDKYGCINVYHGREKCAE